MTNRRFSDEEFLVAGIGGLGLILMILGGLTLGFGTNDGGEAQILLFAGAFLMILGIVLWLFITRPWESYDDLQTPYYTGHDHDHDEHVKAVVVAEPAEVVPVAETAPKQTATEEVVQDVKKAAAAVDEAEVAEVVETADEAVEKKQAKEPPAEVAEAIGMVDEDEAEEVAEVADEVIEDAVETETPAEVKEVKIAVDESDEKVEAAVEDVIEDTTGEPQNLRAIQGIGPKTQDALYAEGITTYAQLAAMSAEELEKVVKEKHNVRIRAGATESWPKQAQFLADGDTDGLEAYQKTL